MKYSIFKDDIPQNTVEYLKTILKDNEINVEELITTFDKRKRQLCPSIRINIKDTWIGTNGKGTCMENALASAYGEFMERLQSGKLVPYVFPDKVKLKKSEINKNIVQDYVYNSEIVNAVPFYSLKDKKNVYIPLCLCRSTNGHAAGNTFEEALVQGFSEIYERYALKKIILNKITLPDIPKEVYMKYDKIKNIIQYYEENGYEIQIKDASIGENLPVIFTVAINKKYNTIIMDAGSHPVLPIAIERTLTELFQGKAVKFDENIKKNREAYINKSYFKKSIVLNPMFLVIQLMLHPVYLEINDSLTEQFITNNSDFEFNKNAWMNYSSETTNKDLLNFILSNIKKITKNQIYIRHISIFGFPTVQIYIPSMDPLMEKQDIMSESYKKWLNYKGETDKFYDDIKCFMEVAELTYNHQALESISVYPSEYLVLLSAIILQDYDRIIKYSDLLIDLPFKKKELFKFIQDFYTLKKNGENEADIYNSLSEKYEEKDILFFKKFIEKLSFNLIKFLILQNKTKENDTTELRKEIRNKLENAFRKNEPNQMIFEQLLK